jgi:hypothetical protein
VGGLQFWLSLEVKAALFLLSLCCHIALAFMCVLQDSNIYSNSVFALTAMCQGNDSVADAVQTAQQTAQHIVACGFRKQIVYFACH